VLLLTVEDTFRIAGRGTLLAPALDWSTAKKEAVIAFDAHLPDGRVLSSSARLTPEHARLLDGGSRWSWILIVDENCPQLPRGTVIEVTRVDPEDALERK
jgi:hypothetical protein